MTFIQFALDFSISDGNGAILWMEGISSFLGVAGGIWVVCWKKFVCYDEIIHRCTNWMCGHVILWNIHIVDTTPTTTVHGSHIIGRLF